MARYRIIEGRFWIGAKTKRLPPNAKLLFIYLVTNPQAHATGLYYLPVSLMAQQTCLTNRGVTGGLAPLLEGGLVKYDDENEVVWVVSMYKYQGAGDSMDQNARKHFATLPKSPLCWEFYQAYPQFADLIPTGGVPGGRQGGHKQEQEQEQEQEQDTQHQAASRPPYGDIVAQWNTMAETAGLPKVRKVPGPKSPLRKRIRTRWADTDFRDNYPEVLKGIADNPFLRGELAGTWGGATFGWVFACNDKGEDNYANVLARAYDDKSPPPAKSESTGDVIEQYQREGRL